MYTPKGELNDKLLALVQDPEKKDIFTGCESPEAGYEKAKKEIPELTMEEFSEGIKIMNAYLEEADREDGELSEEELDSVAGGKNSTYVEGVRDTAYRPEDAMRDYLKNMTTVLGRL